VVVGKQVYAIKTGRLAALDLTTGNQLWQRDVDPDGLSRSFVQAVVGGRVFVAQLDCMSASDPNGTVRAFDAATGSPLWTGCRVVGRDQRHRRGRQWCSPPASPRATGRRSAFSTRPPARWSGPGTTTSARSRRESSTSRSTTRSAGPGSRPSSSRARLLDGGVLAEGRRLRGVPRRPARVPTRRTFHQLGRTRHRHRRDTRYTMAGRDPGRRGRHQPGLRRLRHVVCAFDKATGARAWTSTIRASVDSPTVRAGSSSSSGRRRRRTLLYLPTGQVLNSSTGKVITRLWTGQARR
jgi:hypothetical protein